ncbi:TIGR02281 family clan AA aspartic protease [Oricola cellulosilytica]|uniref:TIGR02281 family clan AA aspartic protease n=1 Tax=Oricola cellulosilytica TaxID=1429082 RepID=A0A4R0P4L8_9HYPH|nr:TIGR02281 family clan AA aspartic protease [Oricola cellulosilytica]TCD11833.1 TIGR02281 family clan AA aspartic protease [Oricola cellulosilytica]
MNGLALIVFGILGAGLLILLFDGNTGMIGPITDEQFASTIYLGLLGIVLAAGLFASGQRFGTLARQAGVWLVLLIVFVTGYEYRFELQESASRVTAGLLPGQPLSSQSAEGELSVILNRRGRHFETVGRVNGSRQSFIVDTGASTVVLTQDNARLAGFDPAELDFNIPVATANGMAMAARLNGVDIAIGDIERRNMVVLVVGDNALETNLLGMNFLDTLSSFEVSRERMTLRN